MPETSTAARLRITEGSVVWIVGRTVEKTTLLDPLPEGVEIVEEPEDDEPHSTDDDAESGEQYDVRGIDAAILFADDRDQLADDVDEVLPRLGSIPVVWISYPRAGRSGVDGATVADLVTDYGWRTVESLELNEDWSAVRIRQS